MGAAGTFILLLIIIVILLIAFPNLELLFWKWKNHFCLGDDVEEEDDDNEKKEK